MSQPTDDEGGKSTKDFKRKTAHHLVCGGGGGEPGELNNVTQFNTKTQIKGFIFNYDHFLHQGTAHDAVLTVSLE